MIKIDYSQPKVHTSLFSGPQIDSPADDTTKEAAQTINLAGLTAEASGVEEGTEDLVQEEQLSVVDEIVETELV